MLLVLLIPHLIVAQHTVDINYAKLDDQTVGWIDKIASNPDARLMMMEMMLNKTDNVVEMRNLVNTFMKNSNMQKFMMNTPIRKNKIQGILPESNGNNSDINKTGETKKTNQETKRE